MKVADIMTRKVVSVAPELSITKLATLLVEQRINAVPVVDHGRLVGIVSEADLIRRPEIGTERPVSLWLSAFSSPEFLAQRFIATHGLNVHDIMSRNVETVNPDSGLAEAAAVMEWQKLRQLPVVDHDELVGIISRADFVRAIAVAALRPAGAEDDSAIRERLEHALEAQAWASQSRVKATVHDHVAHLWGAVGSETIRHAAEILAKEARGVREVKNHLKIRAPGVVVGDNGPGVPPLS